MLTTIKARGVKYVVRDMDVLQIRDARTGRWVHWMTIRGPADKPFGVAMALDNPGRFRVVRGWTETPVCP